MSLDPGGTANIVVVAKDYWLSKRAMKEKCEGRRKFRVKRRTEEEAADQCAHCDISKPVVGH